jgi:transitional endoplasmic reticulum ATPase
MRCEVGVTNILTGMMKLLKSGRIPRMRIDDDQRQQLIGRLISVLERMGHNLMATDLDKALASVKKAASERALLEGNVQYSPDAKVITIPARMKDREAADAILDAGMRLKQKVDTRIELMGHPHEGLVALNDAIEAEFGTLLGRETFNPWVGAIPPRQMTIPVGPNQTRIIPVGSLEIPGLDITLEVGWNQGAEYEGGGQVVVVFHHPRMFESLVRRIEARAREYQRTRSIFKGQAVQSGDYRFLDLSTFDPQRVIYSDSERRKIEQNIINPIVHADEWRKAGQSLRRGVLLAGEFGTGKTLTARMAAWHAVRHGWTFVNVRPGDDLVEAIKFASRYMPAVLFFEDIEAVGEAEDGEGSRVQLVLNNIDGLIGKEGELLTIVTTNYLDRVPKGLLRPGRFDKVLKIGILDQKAMSELIYSESTIKGHSMIDGNLNMSELWAAAEGFTPAFIVEAVRSAYSGALSRGRDEQGFPRITQEDLLGALETLRDQFNLMRGELDIKPPAIDVAMSRMVGKNIEEKVGPLEKQIAEIHKRLF